MLATALRAHLAEFGIIAPQGIHRVEKLAAEVNDPAVPPLACEALMLLVDELSSIWRRIDALEKRYVTMHRANEVSRRLALIPVLDRVRPWPSQTRCSTVDVSLRS